LEDAGIKATSQSAVEALEATAQALDNYKQRIGYYPRVTETNLFDTIKNYYLTTIDPSHIYRNEKEQTNYLAIGSRKNKIIYRNPATIGTGQYSLYWIGANGIDEEGQGDDIVYNSQMETPRHITRRTMRHFHGKGSNLEFTFSVTGVDADRDSAQLVISDANKILYKEMWKVGEWCKDRPELSDADERDFILSEIDRFLKPSHFIPYDSLAPRSNIKRIVNELIGVSVDNAHLDIEVFLYRSGSVTSVLVWDSKRKRIVKAELSR
jgi:hypothetical protein